MELAIQNHLSRVFFFFESDSAELVQSINGSKKTPSLGYFSYHQPNSKFKSQVSIPKMVMDTTPSELCSRLGCIAL